MTTQQSLDLISRAGVAESAADGTPLWWKIQALVATSTMLFVKKLSRNDTSWADGGSNQAGFYVPRQIREAGFFPELHADNPDKPHIFHAEFGILWPQTGETTSSRMRYFSNKRTETHVTRLPKALFQALTPASMLIVGRFDAPTAGCDYWIAVLDSADEEAELLETVLDLRSDFHNGVFQPAAFALASRLQQDEKQELIERLQHALRTGSMEAVMREYGGIPDPASIARDARQKWLQDNGYAHFDPWVIPKPGDAIMQISRDIEFTLYRRYELRRRAAELVALLADKGDLVSAIVHHFADIDRVFLSASQQRKTRAGRSFEHHIAASLSAGNIRFVEQAVTGGRRPDFVMPDLKILQRKDRQPMERWLLQRRPPSVSDGSRWGAKDSTATSCWPQSTIVSPQPRSGRWRKPASALLCRNRSKAAPKPITRSSQT